MVASVRAALTTHSHSRWTMQETVLKVIHLNAVGKMSGDALKCNYEYCITHKLFALPVLEQVSCG